MPLWHIYCPADAYTAPDKQALASAVTDLYAGEPSQLPRFYVSVVFQELPADCFFIGGEPRNNFVRIWINHIAVHMEGDTARHDSFMRRMHAAIGPWNLLGPEQDPVSVYGTDWLNKVKERGAENYYASLEM